MSSALIFYLVRGNITNLFWLQLWQRIRCTLSFQHKAKWDKVDLSVVFSCVEETISSILVHLKQANTVNEVWKVFITYCSGRTSNIDFPQPPTPHSTYLFLNRTDSHVVTLALSRSPFNSEVKHQENKQTTPSPPKQITYQNKNTKPPPTKKHKRKNPYKNPPKAPSLQNTIGPFLLCCNKKGNDFRLLTHFFQTHIGIKNAPSHTPIGSLPRNCPFMNPLPKGIIMRSFLNTSHQKAEPYSKSRSSLQVTHASPLSHPPTKDSKNTSSLTLHLSRLWESLLQVHKSYPKVTWRRGVKSVSHSCQFHSRGVEWVADLVWGNEG